MSGVRMGVGERALLLNLPLAHIAENVKVVREFFKGARGRSKKRAVVNVVFIVGVRRLRVRRSYGTPHFAIVVRIAPAKLQRMRTFELRQRRTKNVGNPSIAGDDRADL